MPTRLPTDTIYADISPSWYETVQPTENGQTWYSAQLYFQGPTGAYGFYSSTGPTTGAIDALRRDAARYLANSQCTGGITNIMPKSFQYTPVYPN
jgi:hypothetical protein